MHFGEVADELIVKCIRAYLKILFVKVSSLKLGYISSWYFAMCAS